MGSWLIDKSIEQEIITLINFSHSSREKNRAMVPVIDSSLSTEGIGFGLLVKQNKAFFFLFLHNFLTLFLL